MPQQLVTIPNARWMLIYWDFCCSQWLEKRVCTHTAKYRTQPFQKPKDWWMVRHQRKTDCPSMAYVWEKVFSVWTWYLDDFGFDYRWSVFDKSCPKTESEISQRCTVQAITIGRFRVCQMQGNLDLSSASNDPRDAEKNLWLEKKARKCWMPWNNCPPYWTIGPRTQTVKPKAQPIKMTKCPC